MAYNHVSAFLLIALILFATANPLAHARNLGLNVSGQICCAPTGNCLGGAGIPNVTVGLNCTSLLGGSTQVGQNTTNVQGRFNISVPNILSLVVPPPQLPLNGTLLPCFAIVQLPLNQTLCPVLSTANRTLVGVIRSVGGLVTNAVGLVLNANVAGFVDVNV